MKKLCMVGHFGFGQDLMNGQTVKTKMVCRELEKQLGEEQVFKIDTHGGGKNYLKIIRNVIYAFRNCENIMILPAHNGIRVFVPLCAVLSFLFNRKLHYIVIGGWLPGFLRHKILIKRFLKKFSGIYVETATMKRSLEEMGLKNIYLLVNFKECRILPPSELIYPVSRPYKLCTFSRVIKEKGIEDAVEAVKQINREYGKTVCTLDIYGQVDKEQAEWFAEMEGQFPDYIKYKGVISFHKSIEVVKNYFALLFPTRFYTEGIPGTILDSYAAGVPVISAKWESFDDVMEEHVTGYGYPFGDFNGFKDVLKMCIEKPELMNGLKLKCIKAAENYQPGHAVKIILREVM